MHGMQWMRAVSGATAGGAWRSVHPGGVSTQRERKVATTVQRGIEPIDAGVPRRTRVHAQQRELQWVRDAAHARVHVHGVLWVRSAMALLRECRLQWHAHISPICVAGAVLPLIHCNAAEAEYFTYMLSSASSGARMVSRCPCNVEQMFAKE